MRHGSVSDPAAWFALAHANMEQAEIALNSHRSEWALEQMQQAAEKAMKGALVRAGIKPKRVHDLNELAEDLEKAGEKLVWFLPTADALVIEYTAARYPGFPDPIPDDSDVLRMFNETKQLLAQLLPTI